MAPHDDAVKAAAGALSEYYEGDGWGYFGGAAEAAVAAAAPIRLAAERARIAAAIRAAGHPDGYHRVDTTREWAGIYCADCAVTERSARIAETAPEGDPPCPTCGHPMTVHDVNEGWICKRHPRIAETAPEEGL